MTGPTGASWPPAPDGSWPSRRVRRARAEQAALLAAAARVENPPTTAVIVALPAQHDPVHQVSDAAHITLLFLGEADTLAPTDRADLAELLRMIATQLHPFVVDVAGHATLGADGARVALVQGRPLSRLQQLLADESAVKDIAARAPQHPSWIPHLTLADSAPEEKVAALGSITIGALGLWLAGRKQTFPLSAAGPAPEFTEDEDAENLREHRDLLAAGSPSIPIITDLRSLRLAIRHAQTHANTRWFVVKRAAAMGMLEEVPDGWAAGTVVHNNGTTARLTDSGTEPVITVAPRRTADSDLDGALRPAKLALLPGAAEAIREAAYGRGRGRR